MRGVARGLAPIRDAYSGGVAYDRQTLDVHRRQLHAMERRDDGRARGGARRALPHARDAVREGHRPALVGSVRPARPPLRHPAQAGRARSPRPARTRRPRRSTSPRSSPSTWSGSGSSQRTTTRVDVVQRREVRARGRAPRSERRARAAERRGRGRADGATRSRPRSNDAAARDPDADTAGIGVRVAVRDEHEGRAAVRPRPRARPGSDRGATRAARAPRGRRRVAGPPAVLAPTASESIRRTSSASSPMPALKAKRRPLTRPRPIRRVVGRRQRAAPRHGVARSAERSRKDARSAAGDEPERDRRR